MRKLAALLLALLMLPGLLPAQAQEQAKPAMYLARLMADTQLLAAPHKGADPVMNLRGNSEVEILGMADPDWYEVRVKERTGYLQRRTINFTKVTVVNPATTPPYPAILASYLGWCAGETPVRAAPHASAEVLTTLQAGARLAFIGFEDGWAKLVYRRQYGYVDTRLLSELQPLMADAALADDSAPIAAYTSFYNTATDAVNMSRMVNIQVGCDRMAALTIRPQERFDFNAQVGPYNKSSGYEPAYVLVDGQSVLGYGGGTCQVSSTLYNSLLQLPGLYINARRPHGPGGARYLPLHADAAVGNASLNLAFTNLYDFPVRIDGSAQDGALTIAIYKVMN